jgi:hypothetical protein
VLALGLLSSCTNLPVATEDAKAPDVFDRIRALDLLPRGPQPVDQNALLAAARIRSFPAQGGQRAVPQ